MLLTVRSDVTQEHVRNTQNKEIYLPQICTNAVYATAPTLVMSKTAPMLQGRRHN
jgi:hypothetical protein